MDHLLTFPFHLTIISFGGRIRIMHDGGRSENCGRCGISLFLVGVNSLNLEPLLMLRLDN